MIRFAEVSPHVEPDADGLYPARIHKDRNCYRCETKPHFIAISEHQGVANVFMGRGRYLQVKLDTHCKHCNEPPPPLAP